MSAGSDGFCTHLLFDYLALFGLFTRLSASSTVSVRVSRGRKARRERLGVRNRTSRSEAMPRRVGLFAVPFPYAALSSERVCVRAYVARIKSKIQK